MHKGKNTLLLRQLQHRFGTLPENVAEELDRLTTDQMDELAEAFLDMASLQQVEDWLRRCGDCCLLH